MAALAQRIDVEEPLATTWGFHHRLLRALADGRRVGRLSRVATPDLRARVVTPSAEDFTVLDPRLITRHATELALHRRLNMLTAELVAAAVHHRATIGLSARNVGKGWPDIFEAERVTWKVLGP